MSNSGLYLQFKAIRHFVRIMLKIKEMLTKEQKQELRKFIEELDNEKTNPENI